MSNADDLKEKLRELELYEPILHRTKSLALASNYTREEYLMTALIAYVEANRELLKKLEAIFAGFTKPIIHNPGA